MNKEDINVTSRHISLLIGDTIVSGTGSEYEVVDIDYNTGMLCISENCNNYNITFDTIAIGYYKKVLRDTNTIKTANGNLSLNVGDVIINKGRMLKVLSVAYDTGLININENGDEYTISLGDIDCIERIDSFTQIVTTNPRKNRLIIIANGFNSHSCAKEDKEDYVAVSNNSPKIGDEITGAEGNKYTVVGIDYNNYEVIVSSADGEEFSFNLDGFDSSVCKKVLK